MKTGQYESTMNEAASLWRLHHGTDMEENCRSYKFKYKGLIEDIDHQSYRCYYSRICCYMFFFI